LRVHLAGRHATDMTLIDTDGPPLRFYTVRDIDRGPLAERLSAEQRQAIKVIGHVLPFRANSYVVDELIDWSAVPDDPIFQLTFPQPGMLSSGQRARMSSALSRGTARDARAVADDIRRELNPHPSGQLSHNVPSLNGELVPGIQHKYHETCLVFPSAGQTCHAYCTFCFRWAQFVGMKELKFATDREMRFLEYLRAHDEVTDVLFTGGDPMVMKTSVIERYVAPLLERAYAHIHNVRFGTKMLAYWPYRLLTDDDADDLLRLLERMVKAGKHVAIMAHFVHPNELRTPAVARAVERLRSVGVVIRTQGPLIRHINDDADSWAAMWREQVRLGMVPYYMFVERDTGAHRYFKLSLARALSIHRAATSQVSGLARTARGPVMSALPGKVAVDGIIEISDRRYFVLSLLQGREPEWCGRPFLAEYDPEATWLTDLRPGLGADEFFYQSQLEAADDNAGDLGLAAAA
jgi:KamA family protein